jgi:hypothetical protein
VKLAYVWYNAVERVTIENLLLAERPSWQIHCIPESEVGDLESAVRLLKAGYDAILLHLSKPPCLALKLAEMAHQSKRDTRVLLISETDAEPAAIQMLFSGHIHPNRDIAMLADAITGFIEGTSSNLLSADEIEDAIVRILNTDSVFQYQFRQTLGVLYRDPFTINDYHAFAKSCLAPPIADLKARREKRVFISYSAEIQDEAMFLRQGLTEMGVASFMAARDLEGGAEWESEIRRAIQTCAEMLILLTPDSFKRPWVMAEMGAAWVLEKRITPCLVCGSLDNIPDVLSRRHARLLTSRENMVSIVEEVAKRIRSQSRYF